MSGVIAWPLALAEARRLLERPADTAGAATAALAGAPCFQNKDFPLSPLPVLVRAEAAERLAPVLTGYAALLGEVVRHFREDARVRAWYGLDPAAERLIAADPGPSDAPWVCRLDGYLDHETERLTVLENNADAPAGTLFTARINEVVAGLSAHGAAGLSPHTFLGADRFLHALLAGARAAAERVPGKSARPSALAVLQPAGKANRESVEMVEQFRAAGTDAFLADPRDLRVHGGRAHFGGRAADLCWNKVNTVSWNAMARDGELVDRWERALRDSSLVHLNPFGARYVAESKLSLAFVQEPEFAGLFTAEQRRLAAELLPWTRRVRPGAVADDGSTGLREDLLERQSEYVLKEAYDIRGDGVTIGHDVPRSVWRAAVERAGREGHIAQRRVRPLQYPVVTAGEDRAGIQAISLDTYLFGGQVAGFGSKASRNAKINIFQGGQKLAVHVIPGEAP
ncbi:hypothetical protein AB0O31_15785 [Kitasatospora cineracea]|uniref:hypothetical protein n=1 Tax=Kitasatospora cineracea TaxID=88074 RepID=UPI0034485FEB